MKSSNPVFARSAEFNGKGTATTSDPSQWQIDVNGSPTHTERGAGRMSLDNVVEKTAITLGVLFAAAAVTWIVAGDLGADGQAAGKAYAFAMGGAIIGLVLSLVNSFKKVISPPLVIAYAV